MWKGKEGLIYACGLCTIRPLPLPASGRRESGLEAGGGRRKRLIECRLAKCRRMLIEK